MLSHFHLDGDNIKILSENILENKTFSSSKTDYLLNRDFYENGFSIFDIVNSKEHLTRSKIRSCSFIDTPEKFIKDICNNSMVIGISATATINSNFNNYDLDYLKSNLQDNFYKISDSEFDRLKNRADEWSKYYKEIDVSVDYIHSGSFVDLFGDEGAANDFKFRVSGDKFVLQRYFRLFTAYKHFIGNRKLTSFICFFNKQLKVDDEKFDLALFKNFAEMVFGESESIVTLSGNNFEVKKSKIIEDLSLGKRRFIVTNYQTVGAGQNLQFPIPKGADYVKINDFEARSEIDINGIYLDKPTNILINVFNSELDDKDLYKYIFQLEFILQSGAISPKDFSDMLQNLFSRNNYTCTNLYNTSVFNRAVVKIILQALGRVSRSNIKSPTIDILIDYELKDILSKTKLPKDLITVKEYEYILDSLDADEYLDNKEIEYINRASTKSNRSSILITRFINQESWSIYSIEMWKEMRNTVLRNPGVVDLSIIDSKFKDLFLELEKSRSEYWYKEEYEFKDVDISFKPNNQYKEVNEIESRLTDLLKIPMLRDYFEEQSYAREFAEYKYMLTPPVFNNIYKGALGEVAGSFIFREIFGIELKELDIEQYEKFDFKTIDGIYVDFKYWKGDYFIDESVYIDKIKSKASIVGAKSVYIINILMDDDTPSNIKQIDNISVIPYLYDTEGNINKVAAEYILEGFGL
ncbi:hypothetical protein EW093_01160 [Thiospirochaeta perfilievii]|uniref:Uncharacterized protein n=1 Tax=Thiospirochaeta perfilievii TaxID=252967 RepID=A0A5C1Q8Z3_9SPIO|nr:hypothetical protein [Thiospirochaeta perfilievii]QEN03369.1 hypothetical protein EW093_01160 [Thiospirochaeta perfilievii]